MRKYFLGRSLSRKGAATATNRRFNKKSNKMNAFKRNAGKVLLGVSVLAGAAYATAGSIQEARAQIAPQIEKTLAIRYFGYNSASGQYEEIPNYDSGRCQTGSQQCGYSTAAPEGDDVENGEVPTNFTPEDANNSLSELITPLGSTGRQYNFN